jgi:hypothetical protein
MYNANYYPPSQQQTFATDFVPDTKLSMISHQFQQSVQQSTANPLQTMHNQATVLGQDNGQHKAAAEAREQEIRQYYALRNIHQEFNDQYLRSTSESVNPITTELQQLKRFAHAIRQATIPMQHSMYMILQRLNQIDEAITKLEDNSSAATTIQSQPTSENNFGMTHSTVSNTKVSSEPVNQGAIYKSPTTQSSRAATPQEANINIGSSNMMQSQSQYPSKAPNLEQLQPVPPSTTYQHQGLQNQHNYQSFQPMVEQRQQNANLNTPPPLTFTHATTVANNSNSNVMNNSMAHINNYSHVYAPGPMPTTTSQQNSLAITPPMVPTSNLSHNQQPSYHQQHQQHIKAQQSQVSTIPTLFQPEFNKNEPTSGLSLLASTLVNQSTSASNPSEVNPIDVAHFTKEDAPAEGGLKQYNPSVNEENGTTELFTDELATYEVANQTFDKLYKGSNKNYELSVSLSDCFFTWYNLQLYECDKMNKDARVWFGRVHRMITYMKAFLPDETHIFPKPPSEDRDRQIVWRGTMMGLAEQTEAKVIQFCVENSSNRVAKKATNKKAKFSFEVNEILKNLSDIPLTKFPCPKNVVDHCQSNFPSLSNILSFHNTAGNK